MRNKITMNYLHHYDILGRFRRIFLHKHEPMHNPDKPWSRFWLPYLVNIARCARYPRTECIDIEYSIGIVVVENQSVHNQGVPSEIVHG